MKDHITYIELSAEIDFRRELLKHMEGSVISNTEDKDIAEIKKTIDMLTKMKLFIAKMGTSDPMMIMSPKERKAYIWIIKVILTVRRLKFW